MFLWVWGPRRQLARHKATQLRRLRTSATFHSPPVFEKSIFERERVGPPREDIQSMRSSWMSLLIIFIDPLTGSHPVPRPGCTREIWSSTFNGSKMLQGRAESADVWPSYEVPGCIDIGAIWLQRCPRKWGPAQSSDLSTSFQNWQAAIPWSDPAEMGTKAEGINNLVDWVWVIELQQGANKRCNKKDV